MDDSQHLKVFVVEDDEWYRELIAYNLELNPDYEVFKFETASECLDQLHENPAVITLDYRLPDMNGEEALEKIKEINPDIEVIVISGQEDIETAVRLLKLGAYDYMVKSDDIRDRLLNIISNIRKNASLRTEIDKLKQEVGKKYDFATNIIGKSDAIKKTFSLMEKAIRTKITVSVTGETGTGKEVVAKAIHFSSKQGRGSFVPVNVAAIPKDLIESELFGHEKGAFTGANFRRIGKFEEANNGTLFLDEIGEMDLNMQVKLLRVLQEKEVVRVGSNKAIKINCRIIVATHRKMREEVQAGNFREDLYFRLIGLPIELPPLRERGNDIVLLANFFLKAFCEENEMGDMTLATETQKKLMSYAYPGNVRELKAVVELAAVMSMTPEIQAEEISFGAEDVLPNVLSKDMSLKDYNYRIVNLYLEKYSNNIKLVAEKLDIGQSTIYRMLKEQK